MIDFNNCSLYELQNSFSNVDNSDDFNKLCTIILTKKPINLKIIYKLIYKNDYVKKFFSQIYTNGIFDIQSQSDLLFSSENMDEITLKFRLLNIFRQCNKLTYIIKKFQTSDENNHVILINYMMQNKLKYDKIIDNYLLKYSIYDLLYKLITINRLNNVFYYYDFNKDIIELIVKFKDKLKSSEKKKLLKRVNINNDNYNMLLSELMDNFTPKQYIEIKKEFNDADIIVYIYILKRYKNDKYIIDGIKCVNINKVNDYFDELFKHGVLNKSNINTIYCSLLKITEFVYPTKTAFFYKEVTRRIDKISNMFIKNDLDIEYVKYYVNNFKIRGFISIYHKSERYYYYVPERLNDHVKQLMQLKRKVQINKILKHD